MSVTPSSEPGADQPSAAVDSAVLEQLVADVGDREFVVETVNIFLEELPIRLSALATGVENSDPDAVRAAAHALKSSAQMMGALPLARMCRAIEALSHPDDGSTQGVAGMVAELETQAAAAAAELRRYVAEPM